MKKETFEAVKARFQELAEDMRNFDGLCPVFHQYSSQFEPQSAAIYIYPDPQEITADWDGEIGTACLMVDYNSLRYQIGIPSASTKEGIAAWLEDHKNQEDVAEMIDNYSPQWRDGNKHGLWFYVPRRFDELQDIPTAQVEETFDWLGGMWAAKYDPETGSALFEGLNINPNDLDAAVEEIEEIATMKGVHLRDLNTDTLERIIEQVEEAWEAEQE